MLLIFFVLFIFKKVISIISIPFQKSFDLNNIENFIHNPLLSEIEIGNPKNKINIYFTFDNSFTFIPKSFYEKYPSKNLKHLDSKLNNYSYQKTIIYGYYSIDSFYLKNSFDNNIIELNYSFVYVESSEKNIIKNGIIGLQINKNQKNIFNYLLDKNIINSYIFTIKYTSNNKGEIILGNYPHIYDNKYNEKNLKIISFNKEFMIKFEEIIFSNNQKDDITKAQFSLELKGIIGSFLYRKFINESFFKIYFINNKCKCELINNEYYIYICRDINIQNFPSIIFQSNILKINFELEYKDLFIKENDIFYFLIFFEKISSFKWILGEPFLKKYQLIINSQEGIIGFYNYIGKKINLFFIFLIILCIIIILILSGLIFKLLFFKNKKIKAKELEYFLINK